jgi:hypothetical protein
VLKIVAVGDKEKPEAPIYPLHGGRVPPWGTQVGETSQAFRAAEWIDG